MSQMMARRYRFSSNLLFQDLYFVRKGAFVKSEVSEAICSDCGKGLEDGVSVTAKVVRQKTKFFCQYHLQINF